MTYFHDLQAMCRPHASVEGLPSQCVAGSRSRASLRRAVANCPAETERDAVLEFFAVSPSPGADVPRRTATFMMLTRVDSAQNGTSLLSEP